jgi:hypothetical protein
MAERIFQPVFDPDLIYRMDQEAVTGASLLLSLLSGALAGIQAHPIALDIIEILSPSFTGLVVDVALHPLDTIKTRMQSPNGFMQRFVARPTQSHSARQTLHHRGRACYFGERR